MQDAVRDGGWLPDWGKILVKVKKVESRIRRERSGPAGQSHVLSLDRAKPEAILSVN